MNKKKGLTLVELLVASILIGIVMVTVASFSLTVQQIQQTTNKATVLSMEASAAMNIMARNASLAIGYLDDPGIIIDTSTPPYVSVSFRQDQLGTADDYTDDTWMIYIFNPTAHTLGECQQNVADGYDSTPATGVGNPCEDVKLLKLSKKVKTANFNLVQDSAAHEFFIELTLITCDDPSLATCDSGVAADRVTNPSYTLQTRISPPAHSWQ